MHPHYSSGCGLTSNWKDLVAKLVDGGAVIVGANLRACRARSAADNVGSRDSSNLDGQGGGGDDDGEEVHLEC